MCFVFLTLGYHPDQVGGAYRYVAEIAEHLAAQGHEVAVVYPADVQTREYETRKNVRLRRYPVSKFSFLRNWVSKNQQAWECLREIVEQRDRVILVVAHAYFALTARRFGKPYLSLFTGPWAEEFLASQRTDSASQKSNLLIRWCVHFMHALERYCLCSAFELLTISDYYVRSLPGWHPNLKASISMIGGGVNLEDFAPVKDRATARLQLGFKNDEFIFLAVRRLDPRMGLSVLIDAFGKLPSHLNTRLLIAGKGPDFTRLDTLIRSLGLEHRIRLMGFVPEAELRQLYCAADCTVTPSLTLEGFGLVLVESLACGTPALGADSGAIPEILSPLSDNLLFKSNSAEHLSKKLLEVGSANAVIPSREECRLYVKNHYSWERPVLGVLEAARRLDAKLSDHKLSDQLTQDSNSVPIANNEERSRRIRILELGKFYHPHHGGIETLLKSWCEGFVLKGAEVDCLVAQNSGPSVSEELAGVHVHRVRSWGTVLSTSVAPGYLLKSNVFDCDLWHAHFPNPLADLAVLSRLGDRKLVISYHSDVIRQAGLLKIYEPILQRVLNRADSIVVATPNHFVFSPWLQPYREKVAVIPFGIDLSRFAISPLLDLKISNLRSLAKGRNIVLSVGRLVTYKGHRFLLDACRSMDSEVWLVGTGPLEEELRKQARELGMEGRVRFWGAVQDQDLPAFMNVCDVFAFPSITPNEAFGLAQVEAMACAKPVISCDLKSGVPFVNQHNVTGRIVPPENSSALGDALRLILNNPELARRMGQNGQKRAFSEFSLPVMIDRYWSLFSRLIG